MHFVRPSLVLGLILTATLAAAKPNVLLILADDMSPHLSMLGTPGIETPNIDALAKAGIYFEHAFSASASCSPSRTAILTGMWPHSNGNWRNVHSPALNAPDADFTPQAKIRDKVGIGSSVATLPEILKKNGYYTSITQKLHLSPAWRYPYDGRHPVQSTPGRFKTVIKKFIDDSGERPFFIQANVAAPHRPYRSHLAKNRGQKLPDAATIEIPPFLPDVPGVRRDMQEYFACVEIADACVGSILKALEEKGVLGETLIVFTSDQGMPIHHAKASGYPGGTRIPMSITGPDIQGKRLSKMPVSQIDLAPTILDFIGIEIPDTMQGISLLPITRDEETSLKRKYVFAEHNSHGPDQKEHYPQRVVTDGTWYYVRNLNPKKPQRLPDDLRGVAVWGNHAYADIIAAKDENPFQAWFLTRFSQPRPAEHLYQIDIDPWGVNDLASHPATLAKLLELRVAMDQWRTTTNDIKKSPLEIPEHKNTN